ncbi:MAG: HsdM family class I SAM-dependent methyltransferase, partial [Caldisericum sp.]
LKQGKTTLKKILLDLEELVLGNAGVDPFEEIFKLIYAKLYDEWRGINDPSYQLEFFVGDRSPEQVKKAIANLLEGAKREWQGVFEPTDKIELRDDHLKVCVSFLEKIKLFNSNLQIIDEAFEYLIPQVSKKKEGQFFTPRPVIDMVVKMLNPKPTELVIDPACGSSGFLLHSVEWIKEWIKRKTLDDKVVKDFAQRKIYGIDFSEKAVKIAKAINLIIGNGESHIYKDNALAPHTWTPETRAGLTKLLLEFKDPQKNRENQENFTYFRFDVLMTNPPFAGTIKEAEILELYELAKKDGRLVNQIDRHILFVERSLQFIKPGGRMAIVLPQGLLNNTKAEYIRRFIINEARVLAVVGLHVNTFKPHTGTKTSVLFLRKYTDEEKKEIQQIRAKYESEWEEFLKALKEKFESLKDQKKKDKDLLWDISIEELEEGISEELKSFLEELKSFLETYVESKEEIEESPAEKVEGEEMGETTEQEKKGKIPLAVLVQELTELEEVLKEKMEELKSADAKKRNELRKEVKTLQSKRNKLEKEISQRTLAGQINLVLNEERITEAFKKYWLDGKVMQEIDYPIFFAVNEKPVKDESGEYRYKKAPNGDLVMDEHGHPVIEHDLDEIAEAFIKFAKEQGFDFWR